MPGTRAPYPPEFRAEAMRLARVGAKSVPAIAGDLGISRQASRERIVPYVGTTPRSTSGSATSR